MRDWVKPDIEIEMTLFEIKDRILNNATVPKGDIELLIENMKEVQRKLLHLCM